MTSDELAKIFKNVSAKSDLVIKLQDEMIEELQNILNEHNGCEGFHRIHTWADDYVYDLRGNFELVDGKYQLWQSSDC